MNKEPRKTLKKSDQETNDEEQAIDERRASDDGG